MTGTVQTAGLYAASKEFVAAAHVDAEGYAKLYADSMADPAKFWGDQGKRLDWI